MDTTLNAAFASERQHQLRSEAATYRRSPKSTKRHRVSRFLKDLAAASL